MNKDPKDLTFQIRTYKSKHNCRKKHVNMNMDYKWLVEKYIDFFLEDYKFSLPSFQNLGDKDYAIIVLRMKL